MHIEVPGGLSIEQAHKIELKTADNIRDCAEEPINEINIHTDPESLNEWKHSNW
jgi:divalent metal cation (Fe/Co/Zn/Cd) transporter